MVFYGIPIILKEGARTEEGKRALNENITAIRAISEAIKSTYGPAGLGKMLVDTIGDVTVSNDCYTILDEIEVDHPAAKMAIELSKTMNKNCGDGVTKSVIFAGELLKAGYELIDQDLHPNTIINGFKKALTEIKNILNSLKIKIDITNKDILKKIALTALNTKNTFGAEELLSEMAVKTIDSIKELRGNNVYADLDLVQIMKKEGEQVKDSLMINGLIIDKEVVNATMPKIIKNAKIALINHSLEITKTEFDTDIRIMDPAQINAFKEQEEKMIKEMVEKIAKTGANVVFCQKGIDDLAQHYLAKHGIMAIRRVKRSDLIKLSKATHGKIIIDIDSITANDLGTAEVVKEEQVGKDKMIFIENCLNPKSISVLIRGGTKNIVDDAENSFKNALGALKVAIEEPYYVPGGGAIEIEIAKLLRKYSQKINSRESIAIETFANVIETLPNILISNAGLDPMEYITELRAKHEEKNGLYYGIDLKSRKIIDVVKEGIIEPSSIIFQSLSVATELSIMILRIDRMIRIAPLSKGPQMPNEEDSDFD
ncbi:MAG: thermosome subunit beta [Promethearchaeota archaeon]